uniref:GPI-anchored protein LLG1-like domain-containing protein n=1 Tax=Arundo donax TaxID=35708 RepID=A0A0A9FD03_ARUDO
MAADLGLLLLLLSAAALAGLASAAGPSLPDGVFQESAGSTGRSLLQAKKKCPMSFEFQNYTIITSKCKGPKFPADKCCGALLEFACPFSDYVNDLTNDCATTMFSYINLNGKYPPGVFASECKGNKNGLPCSDVPQTDSTAANDGQQAQSSSLALLTLICGLLALLFL